MEVRYEYITTDQRLKAVIPEFYTYKIISIDTETRSLSPFDPFVLRSIQIATNHNFCYVINAAVVDPRPLKHVLENPKILKLGQNLKFDIGMLKQQCGISVVNIFDSMLGERLLSAGLYRKNSLAEIAKKYLGVSLDKTIRKGFIGSTEIDLTEEEIQYAARDACILFELYPILVDKLKEQGLWAAAILENRCVPVFSDMELAGVLIDIPRWQKLIDKNVLEKDKLTKELEELAIEASGQQTIDLFGNITSGINFRSNQQLVDLFDDLGVDAEDTKESTLVKLDDPFVKKLLEFKEREKSLNSFGQKFLDLINPITGRIHPSYNQYGADSGRVSANSPNLQQIPTGSEFRSCFIAREGYKIITSDFSGQELRVLTQLSGEPTYIKAFNNNADLHAATAAGIYKISEEEVTKKQRQAAKIINFTCAYGGGPGKIALSLEITKDEAVEILNRFYKAIPKLKAWLDKAGKDAFRQGFAETVIGRKRYFVIPDESNEDYNKIKGSIERQGKNMCIQGASADMIKLALIGLSKALKKYDARIINCVHDEIVVEAREDQAEEIAKIVAHEMIKAGEKIISVIPVAVDVHIEDCWSKG